MSSERAGLHTSGALDREQLLPLIAAAIDDNYDEDRYAPVYSERGRIVDSAAARAVLNALEASVVPDPRIAGIEALIDEQERTGGKGLLRAGIDNIRAILRDAQ